MGGMEFDKSTIRRFLLAKHKLLLPRSLSGEGGISEVFNTLRVIQFDPLNPCGNNVDLVLQSRVHGIHVQDYYQWLYMRKQGVECLDKELCVVPIEDLKLCRGTICEHCKKLAVEFKKEHHKEIVRLITRIKNEGPLSPHHIIDDRKIQAFWGNPRWGRAALEVLWKTGILVIAKRENGRKYYDLSKRFYGKSFQWHTGGVVKAAQIIRRVEAVGIIAQSGTGQAWLGMGKSKEIIPVISKLIKQKKLITITIKDSKRSYLISAKDFPLIEKLKTLKYKPQMSFIAPLDNLLWDRTMIRDIFGFDYKWEVYTPQQQRKHGYYVLPILYGDRFIGRIEPKKVAENLEIRGIWLESGVHWDEKVKRSFEDCLKHFQQYTETKTVIWKCKKPKSVK